MTAPRTSHEWNAAFCRIVDEHFSYRMQCLACNLWFLDKKSAIRHVAREHIWKRP